MLTIFPIITLNTRAEIWSRAWTTVFTSTSTQSCKIKMLILNKCDSFENTQCLIPTGVFLSHWCTDLFMYSTVHIRIYNVKSHWKVQGHNFTPAKILESLKLLRLQVHLSILEVKVCKYTEIFIFTMWLNIVNFIYYMNSNCIDNGTIWKMQFLPYSRQAPLFKNT